MKPATTPWVLAPSAYTPADPAADLPYAPADPRSEVPFVRPAATPARVPVAPAPIDDRRTAPTFKKGMNVPLLVGIAVVAALAVVGAAVALLGQSKPPQGQTTTLPAVPTGAAGGRAAALAVGVLSQSDLGGVWTPPPPAERA
jgi:hypothetical protein